MIRNLLLHYFKLDSIQLITTITLRELWNMSQMFDVMETKVSELKTVNDSVLELITRLVAGIQGALTLQEAQKIVAEVDVEKQRLADAVTANT